MNMSRKDLLIMIPLDAAELDISEGLDHWKQIWRGY